MHRAALVLTFGGGTNEVQRDIIGMVALGLPPPRPGGLIRTSPEPKRRGSSGLVATIVDTVCTPEHQAGGRLDQETRYRVVRSRSTPTSVHRRTRAVGGGGFGDAEQTAILTGLVADRSGAVSATHVVLRRRRPGPVRPCRAAAGVGHPAVGEKVLTPALDGEPRAPVR